MSEQVRKTTTTALMRLVLPVILIWGCNFAVIRIGVHEIGPFSLAALRFLIAAVPLVFLVRKPNVPYFFIIAYGATFGLGQFGLLFFAIKLGLPSGMASLLVQLQVVFTPLFAFIVLGQRVPLTTLGAITVSLIGLGVILFATTGVSAVPIILGTAAALSWGASNVVVAWGTSRGYAYNPVALVIWASALLPIPFLIAAGFVEELNEITLDKVLSALLPAFYLGTVATVIAYHFWVKAMSVFPPASVAPFSLMIPVIGLLLGYVIFGETPSAAEIIGCGLVIIGVVIHMTGLRVRSLRMVE